MPANLPPHYYEEEKKLKSARTPEEKIAILETLLSMIPKHKGTEKLQSELKQRLSKARDQVGKKKGGSRRTDEHHVEKEGAGQIVLAGMPNVGKSQILGAFTRAVPQIADYPYSTLKPLSGMARFENIRIQLVDIPPLFWEVTDTWVSNILRNSDAICLVVELHDDPAGQVELLLEELKEKRIEPLETGGQPGQRAGDGIYVKPILIVGNKLDLPEAAEGLKALKLQYASRFTVVGISAMDGQGGEAFLLEAFHILNKIRVYTKTSGKKPDLDRPFVFPKGITVIEMAGGIHKDFIGRFQAARIYSEDKYNGQRVSRDFELRDGDIIELIV